jgi:hypothetical protein
MCVYMCYECACVYVCICECVWMCVDVCMRINVYVSVCALYESAHVIMEPSS